MKIKVKPPTRVQKYSLVTSKTILNGNHRNYRRTQEGASLLGWTGIRDASPPDLGEPGEPSPLAAGAPSPPRPEREQNQTPT